MIVWDLTYINDKGEKVEQTIIVDEQNYELEEIKELLNEVIKIKDIKEVIDLDCDQQDDDWDEDEDCEYDYDDAVAWLEDHGVSCDPGNSVGEYVCDLLDDYGDDNDGCYTYSELEMILEDALKYKEEVEEEEEDE